MTILLKYLSIIVPTAFASKLIFIQHIIFKYNRILQQASESYSETFIGTTNGFLLIF
jgi:hypothetical protein